MIGHNLTVDDVLIIVDTGVFREVCPEFLRIPDFVLQQADEQFATVQRHVFRDRKEKDNQMDQSSQATVYPEI